MQFTNQKLVLWSSQQQISINIEFWFRLKDEIVGLNKFKTCALNSISVDYTGEAGRFAAYEEDSQPVTTLITLNFTELVPIYDADYEEFTNDDDVGL